MEQVRQSTLVKWNRGLVNIGPVPEIRRYKIVKSLSGCFTHRDNPHRSKTSNEHFHRELDEILGMPDVVKVMRPSGTSDP